MKGYYKSLLTFFIFLFFAIHGFSQDEFMIHGRIRVDNDSIGGARIIVKSESGYKKIEEQKLKGKGDYRLFFKYGANYQIILEKEGYLPLRFDLKLKLPKDIKECCFLPLEMSLHLFKPSNADSLFKGTLYVIEYQKSIKNFNYALDVDFMIQNKLVQAEIDQKEQIIDAKRRLIVADSLHHEKMYMTLINKGNMHFSKKEWAAARQYFLKAQEVLPRKKYPAYKLEDIKTELELFAQQQDSLNIPIDTSFMSEKIALDTTVAPAKVYKKMTPEEIDAKFMADLKKRLIEKTGDTNIAKKQMTLVTTTLKKRELEKAAFADSVAKADSIAKVDSIAKIDSIAKLTPIAIDTTPVIALDTTQKIAVDTIKPIIATTEPIADTTEPIAVEEIINTEPVELPAAKPTIDTVVRKPIITEAEKPKPIIDYKTYQDSLLQKYTTEKTIEYEEDLYKKTMRVILRHDNIVEVFLKVDHAWGATFYFKERLPKEYENITASYFLYITNIDNKKQPIDSVDIKHE